MLRKKYSVDLLIAGIFIFFSLCLYLFRITEITPGVWGDEVALGAMVEYLKTLGSFTPFISYNLGHPTPLIYLSSFFISILGKNIISLRIISVLFGALCVGVFYLFLRSVYSRFLAIAGSVLFATSYVFIVVTRFAYEMSAAIFFFIASSFFLFQFSKKHTVPTLIFLGIVLGAGLYTYLAFRTICFIYICITVFLIFREKRKVIQHLCFFFVSFFIIILPLLTYSIRHFDAVNERVQILSVFNQHLSKTEVIKELTGAAERTFSLFFLTGDPNPRQNPAGTIPFDYVTVLLFIFGLIVLMKQKPKMGLGIIGILLTILGTEIITLEQIPEFHYYGLGHPNTLRISPLVPVIIFVVVYGLQHIQRIVKNKNAVYAGIIIMIALISIINMHRYYGQKITPWIYETNYVPTMHIIDTLNTNKPTASIAVSSTLYTSEHVKFFLNPEVHLVPMSNPIDCSFANMTTAISIFLVQDLKSCTKEQLETLIGNTAYRVDWMVNPWNTYDALILYKK